MSPVDINLTADLPQLDNYLQLFTSNTPLIDVRAPVEFNQGAFPTAKNLPLMNDDERQAVGLRYKQQGQDKAIKLGQQLVSGDVKSARIDDWVEFVNQHPHGALYCFRGGLRSKICQQWIYEQTGLAYPRIFGGYKALRRFLIDELDANMTRLKSIVIGGRTGVGKTLLLQRLNNHLDLEDIFHHRGSAFGKHVTPQPAQINIENNLSIRLIRLHNNGFNSCVLEDEASNIGSRRLPDSLVRVLSTSPLIVLEATMIERVDNVFDEYINASLAEYRQLKGNDEGFSDWANNLIEILTKIQRRLGGARYKKIKDFMDDAILEHRLHNKTECHKIWIQSLLEDYYDPMYDYQLQKKAERIIYKGNRTSVLDCLKNITDKP